MPNSIGDGQHTFMPFPFTLAYAMAMVERIEGVEAMIIDAIAEDLDRDEYLRRVKDFGPDLLISEMSTESHRMDLEVAEAAKRETGARVAVCGPHASAVARELLDNEFLDFVLVGEYEQTTVDLIGCLRGGESYEGMGGLGYRTADGEIVVGEKRPLMPELDALPLPHRETLPMSSYSVAGFPGPVLFMYASRGCPYRCTFCVWPQWFKSGSYRTRSPESVIDEIEDAQKRFGPFGSIYFDDDTFNLGGDRMRQMARLFKERGMKLPWGCNARPDQFNPEMMRELAEAGLFNIRIGVESADPEVLRRTKKDLDISKVQPCIDMAHDNGVKVHVTFTIGLSGESWDSVKRTAAFAKSITPDSIAFTVTTPFPGTEYYDEVVRDGFLETRDWDQFNVVSNSVVRTETMSRAEILKAEKYVMRQVYSSPRYLLRRLSYAGSPSEVLALARKGTRFLMRRF
ncbi:B12-binding domain-containing radical SAM protein [Pseudobythopirellula maris]|uniref:B12-binding domain-containing radical SAM protein n=1 Tax=Pseudobythopirellula maris TaxID=2527991 RepID=UPI0018D40293|nr:radical SAM protein [Pseudobythopirellula maris]